MSDFSVLVMPADAEPGMTVDLGFITVNDDCGGLNVTGYSDSVHAANYLMIGGVRLDGTENGVSNWLVDLSPGTYPVVYVLGERGVGEKPLGASFDFDVEEVACPVTTTSSSTSSTSSTSTSSTSSTSTSTTVTSLPPGSTTTTMGATTTTGGDTVTTIVTTTTVAPPSGPTLPETGPTDMVGLVMMAVALIVGGVAVLKSRRLSND